MTRDFLDFLERLWACVDVVQLEETMSSAAIGLDLCDFAYLVLPNRPKEDTLLISTYRTAWTAHYLQSRYERIDPVIVQAQAGIQPFEWGDGGVLGSTSRPQRQLFDEAAQFGIRQGFTIPIHDRAGQVAAVTFATDMRRAPFSRCIAAHGEMLQCMAACFHARARHIIVPDRVICGISLSPREHECLHWAAHGKSAWDIGHILGISPRTAGFHLENAKAKLGVRTIPQAVTLLATSRK